jgi:hypothetical protein
MGLDHEYCQDYATSGNIRGFKYAIVCDGCSQSHESSREVDLGAAMLSKFAYLFVKDFAERTSMNSEVEKLEKIESLDVNDVMRHIFYESKMGDFKKRYGFHDHAFDATLILAISYNGKAKVFVFGDGGFCVEREISGVNIKDVYNFNYSSGAPFYLNYHTDEHRKQGYGFVFGEYPYTFEKVELVNGVKNEDCVREVINNYCYKSFFIDDFITISIFSDGVSSFEECGHRLDFISVVNELTNFKQFKGNFVYRRIRAAKKQYGKCFTNHSDDISLASISMK